MQTELLAAVLALYLVLHVLEPELALSIVDLHGKHAIAATHTVLERFLRC